MEVESMVSFECTVSCIVHTTWVYDMDVLRYEPELKFKALHNMLKPGLHPRIFQANIAYIVKDFFGHDLKLMVSEHIM